MSSAKTARWLDLIAYLLQHRFPVSREEIFRNVHGYLDPDDPESSRKESVRRTFERDKDELRSLGIALETVPIPDAAGDEPAAGYRLRPGAFYLPYLELHPKTAEPEPRTYQGLARVEVSLADLAILDRATHVVAQRTESLLGRSAASARRKLEFDLPLPQSAIERLLARPLSEENTRTLEVLQDAVSRSVAVSCKYHSIGRDSDEERSIEPYGLFFNWGRWYCVARARDRDALRVFRVDRMRNASLERGREGTFQVPADFSIRSYVGRAPWELSGTPPTITRVRFAFPESRWVQAQGVGEVIEPMMEDGGAVLEFAVQDSSPFLRWLLTFRNQAEVLSPSSMIEQLEQMRQAVARLYA
ncbi:MAG: WYL domain-containing protein [Gemmatimonadota bacterium]